MSVSFAYLSLFAASGRINLEDPAVKAYCKQIIKQAIHVLHSYFQGCRRLELKSHSVEISLG